MEHGIVERRRQVLQRHVAAGAVWHRRTVVLPPLFAQPYDVLRQWFEALTVVAEGQQILFLGYEVYRSVLVDEPDGDDVVAFAQQSLGYVVSPRGVLVVGSTHLLAVDVGDVGVEERSQQQPCRLPCMLAVDVDVLSEPRRADASPSPVVLADGLPPRVVIVWRGEQILLPCSFPQSRVALVEHLVPPPVGQLVGLLLCAHVGGIVVETCLLYQHRIVVAQRVGRYPCLDGRSSPAVDDDSLRHVALLVHLLAEEIADCREEPCVLFRHGLPVDARRAYIVLGSVGVGLVLHAEEAYHRVLVAVDFPDVLGIDALDCHVDIRLSRAEPHVAEHHVVHLHVVRPQHIGAAGLHLLVVRQCQCPSPVGVGRGGSRGKRLALRPLYLAEAYADALAGIGPAPYGDVGFALQHYAVLEQ